MNTLHDTGKYMFPQQYLVQQYAAVHNKAMCEIHSMLHRYMQTCVQHGINNCGISTLKHSLGKAKECSNNAVTMSLTRLHYREPGLNTHINVWNTARSG